MVLNKLVIATVDDKDNMLGYHPLRIEWESGEMDELVDKIEEQHDVDGQAEAIKLLVKVLHAELERPEFTNAIRKLLDYGTDTVDGEVPAD